MQNMLKQGRPPKTKTNELYAIAEKNNTEIICCELPNTCSVSTVTASGNCYIGLDPFRIETLAQEKVHLAHELGHCETGAFYEPYSMFEIRERQEAKADRWAAERLVPAGELEEAFSFGITEVWELAEHFGVTEDFMRIALDYYRVTTDIIQ